MVAAAVRAAILAKAPRRTVSAVAAAVVGALGRPAAAEATRRPAASATSGAQRNGAAEAPPESAGGSPEELLAALRAARAAQRRRKKLRRKVVQEADRPEAQGEEMAVVPQVLGQGGVLAPSHTPTRDEALAAAAGDGEIEGLDLGRADDEPPLKISRTREPLTIVSDCAFSRAGTDWTPSLGTVRSHPVPAMSSSARPPGTSPSAAAPLGTPQRRKWRSKGHARRSRSRDALGDM